MNPFLDFQEVRCPSCNKLLFRVRGVAEVEIVCPRCPGSKKVLWPDFALVRFIPVIQRSLTIPSTAKV